MIQQGSLYPALYRLEHDGDLRGQWGESENNRRARYYSLTPQGVTVSSAGLLLLSIAVAAAWVPAARASRIKPMEALRHE